MPTGKDQDKRDNYKKPQNKGFSTASWEDRLTDNREEDDGDITDPELAAEKTKSTDNAKKDALISAKIKQAKADRKARGRGVSGSMCKKDKDISCGGFHTLMDMDVYYGLDDEYGTYMSDTEEPFDGHEDGYEGVARQDKKEKMDKSKATLINEDMNKMSLNDDNEREDDDRPGPSRSHHGASDDEKPKRLYRIVPSSGLLLKNSCDSTVNTSLSVPLVACKEVAIPHQSLSDGNITDSTMIALPGCGGVCYCLPKMVGEGRVGWMRRVVVFLKEEGRLVSLFWVAENNVQRIQYTWRWYPKNFNSHRGGSTPRGGNRGRFSTRGGKRGGISPKGSGDHNNFSNRGRGFGKGNGRGGRSSWGDRGGRGSWGDRGRGRSGQGRKGFSANNEGGVDFKKRMSFDIDNRFSKGNFKALCL
ncbi:hypothetical protein DINM_020616 [Dirofilaria immitis]|nr:hypothetical protein [Dirofilaria immitis]